MPFLRSIGLLLFRLLLGINLIGLAKQNGVKAYLDCSKFQRDLDVLRSFPYSVQVNPFTTGSKSYAIMNAVGQVEQLYIVQESTVTLDVFCLVHLHTLKVTHTRFSPEFELDDNSVSTALPSFIGRLNRLRTLSLFNTSTTRLPSNEFGQLQNLITLEIQSDSLLEFPLTISSLQNLRTLTLSNNPLISLPTTIGSLIQLQTLNLMNNRLTSLPATIGGLIELQTLYVSNNSISTLPSSLGSQTNITTINVGMNPVASLQPLSPLPKLTTLQASRCQLTVLPRNLSALTSFYASYSNLNDISYLPDMASTKLSILDLANNRIDYVPPQISRFAPSLQTLYLNDNSLYHLPTEISLLTQLLQMNIANNVIPSSELNAIWNSVRQKIPRCVLTYTPQKSFF